ncbi:Acyl-CoA desaturase [Balamuthia mandrillaris]
MTVEEETLSGQTVTLSPASPSSSSSSSSATSVPLAGSVTLRKRSSPPLPLHTTNHHHHHNNNSNNEDIEMEKEMQKQKWKDEAEAESEAKRQRKAEQVKERLITEEELARHNSPGDYWLSVGLKVYNVSSFVERHPGGDLILQGVGKDVTVLFETSHGRWVRDKVLPKFYIGRLVSSSDQACSSSMGVVVGERKQSKGEGEEEEQTMRKRTTTTKTNEKNDPQLSRPEDATTQQKKENHNNSPFVYSKTSPFYDELRDRVEAHLKQKGLSRQDAPQLYLQTFLTLAFFLYFYWETMVQGHVWSAIPCGWFFSQLGIIIMHDGNHGAFSKRAWLSKVAGCMMDVMGASSLVWKHEHNIGHHQFTNSTQDPDSTTAFPLIRYNPGQAWRPYHRLQHLYVWLLYPWVCFKWYVSDVGYVLRGHYRGMPMYNPPTWELWLLALTKVAQPCWLFLVAVYWHGFVHGLLLLCLVVCTAGYCFSLQFVVTHLAEDVIFPEQYNRENDWAKCQIMTSSNYSYGSALATWLSGGLNYQIEHHLFPTLAHVNLPHIAPIVRGMCEEQGVPYFVHPDFFAALLSHYAHVKRMGQPPSEAAAASSSVAIPTSQGLKDFPVASSASSLVGVSSS